MTGAAVALALLAQEASAFTAFVSNEKGNTVSVIDLDKMEVTATIEVGEVDVSSMTVRSQLEAALSTATS
jgi:YVTN family beta-propeller protein